MEKETFKVILGYDTDIEEINSDTISFTVSSDSQFRHEECNFCLHEIHDSEPRILYKDKLICSTCYIDLISKIYEMAGMGDGGLINYAFNHCITTSTNRRNRNSLKANKTLFNKLLHKYNFKCVHCDEKEVKKLTIDHIKPVSKGGSDSFINLQILCKSCNSRKGAKYDG